MITNWYELLAIFIAIFVLMAIGVAEKKDK